MKRLIVDVSSVVKTCLFAGTDDENGHKVEHEGKLVQVNSAEYGLDNAINSMATAFETLGLTPSQTILVVESGNSKSRRQMLYKAYKDKGTTTAPAVFEEYGKARDQFVDTFRKLGATVVTQPNIEADDVIAYLVERLKGERIIFSADGDMAVLLKHRGVALYRKGMLTTENPYGPFHPRYIPVYKALVGDSSDSYKGAAGFGEKAWLDLLVGYDEHLDALEIMLRDKRLVELEDDVADFPKWRKVIDGAEHVYVSYQLALLRPEWVNTDDEPMRIDAPVFGLEPGDYRLRSFKADTLTGTLNHAEVAALVKPVEPEPVEKLHAVFDTEIIGDKSPVFLVCAKIIETGETFSWWGHAPGHMRNLEKMLARPDITWVSFNGLNFDAPIMALAIYEAPDTAGLSIERVRQIKDMAQAIIVENVKPWELGERFVFRALEFDHIDLIETAPGVRISLKTYAGRMGYKSMVDMPFEHDQDLMPDQFATLERYCLNDLGVTEALFGNLRNEINLREAMGREYGLDLRSKSDAQVAEAVLRKVLGLVGRQDRSAPKFVKYKAPSLIQTDSEVILDLIQKLEAHEFKINYANGSPEAPDFLSEPIQLGRGTYKVGIGGLHSTHDKSLYRETTEWRAISDFDVASYYPNIMLNAGIIPSFDGNESLGRKFIETYRSIYEKRIEAKRSGNKSVANSLKITLNGAFGKLGSIYSAFYAPDLMLGVTITGQLNLMCIIHELEKIPGVLVLSANTDGIMVSYGRKHRDEVLRAVKDNAAVTGFEYEETPYSKIAVKDVNNYIAITDDADAAVVQPDGEIKVSKSKGGKDKRKGLYASNDPKKNPLFLMKNPTMEVCANLAVDYLRDGVHPSEAIGQYRDIKDFVAIRNVKGGGVQPAEEVEVDDWVLVKDLGTKDNEWARPGWEPGKVVRRKSRPKPVTDYRGGEAFGRIARWYMTTQAMPPITYRLTGNKVPKTEGARVCMSLPDELPADLDLDWYVGEACSVLADLGLKEFAEVEAVSET